MYGVKDSSIKIYVFKGEILNRIFVAKKPLFVSSNGYLGFLKRRDRIKKAGFSGILDPFAGSSTTGIAANLLNRKFVGIDNDKDFLALSKSRKIEIENISVRSQFKMKIKDIHISERI